MKANPEQRNSQRFYYQKPVTLEDVRTRYRYGGLMANYSESGMYLESDYAPRPGRKLHIEVDRLPNISKPQTDEAEVKWRRPLTRNPSPFAFGIGVKYD